MVEDARRSAGTGLGAFVLGLLLSAALLNRALDAALPPRVGRIAPQAMASLLAEAPVDLVFLGSSRFHADIDPRVVDAALARAGRPLESFNLGVAALGFVEQQRLVDWLGGVQPRPPRYVVLEPILNANAELGNVGADRTLAAHDPAATWRQLRYVAATDAGLLRKLRFASLHLLSCGIDLANVGKVPRLLSGGPPASTGLDPRLRGCGSLGPGAAPPGSDPHGDLMRSGEAFRMLEGLPRYDPEGPQLPEPQLAALLRSIDGARRLGAQPILLVTPRFDWDAREGRSVINPAAVRRFLRSHARVFPDVPLLRYDDPALAPELYHPELWFDSSHLNADGARLFSERLGNDLARLLARAD